MRLQQRHETRRSNNILLSSWQIFFTSGNWPVLSPPSSSGHLHPLYPVTQLSSFSCPHNHINSLLQRPSSLSSSYFRLWDFQVALTCLEMKIASKYFYPGFNFYIRSTSSSPRPHNYKIQLVIALVSLNRKQRFWARIWWQYCTRFEVRYNFHGTERTAILQYHICCKHFMITLWLFSLTPGLEHTAVNRDMLLSSECLSPLCLFTINTMETSSSVIICSKNISEGAFNLTRQITKGDHATLVYSNWAQACVIRPELWPLIYSTISVYYWSTC